MSIDQTLQERGARYGDFSDHARICQAIKSDMTDAEGWERLSDVQKQALEVIADKIARILSGDPNYADNWHDIQGYAKLAEDRLPRDALEAVAAELGMARMESSAQPANQMEDDSQRMAAIGQNGNTGEHYGKEKVIFSVDDDLIKVASSCICSQERLLHNGAIYEVLSIEANPKNSYGAKAKVALREIWSSAE